MKAELAYTAGIAAAAVTVFAVLSAQSTANSYASTSLAAPSPLFEGLPDANHTNWEIPHVHPLELTPDGSTLLAVNTADAKLEVFDVTGGTPVHIDAIAVGLGPVSVRAQSNRRAWVVNHLSDSVSIIDLQTLEVVHTFATGDEPADVAFAGSPRRAFVSCAQDNTIEVFDSVQPGRPLHVLELEAQDPRALVVSNDGLTVHAAIYEGGNRTTIIGGGAVAGGAVAFPPSTANDPSGPWGGQNPPPNDGTGFYPPLNPALAGPLPASLILKQMPDGRWMDDSGGDWTDMISGPNAAASGRLPGWQLLDHDVAHIDTATLTTTYTGDLNNINMALTVHPTTGEVFTVGTDAINHIRFEPILNSRFLRVNIASAGSQAVTDLNPHLLPHYTDTVPFVPLAQSERDKSIGDPRDVVFGSGTLGYVAGMGSNNVLVVDTSGARAGLNETIEVGEGPTGLALDEAAGRLFVLNKFAGSITTIDTAIEAVVETTPFFDPTPASIKDGRKFLYDTHLTSGTGHVSCASCHVDGRMDNLAWDLGDPSGDMKTFNQNCLDGGCEDWHPMKGPMTTQTLVDIIGKEPHHWRGDREGIEAFNGAFMSILGDDVMLTPAEMQQFEDMLATMHFPANPYRNLDNSLPTNMDMSGHYTIGRFAPAGQPLPNGDAQAGLLAYRTAGLDGIQCVTCHTLDTGAGPDGILNFNGFIPIPPGPNGEAHLGINSVDGFTNVSMKVPQLRNMHEKTGFNTTLLRNTAGFGYVHDGSVDSIERFVGEPVFQIASLQMLTDVTAFMLAFAGGDLPQGSPTNFLEPPGPPGRDTHAAVGTQGQLLGALTTAAMSDLFNELQTNAANHAALGLIAKGNTAGEARGWFYLGGSSWQSDRTGELATSDQLVGLSSAEHPIVFTAVVESTAERLGIDRDLDGHFDRDELDACANPADPFSTPANSVCCIADVTTTNTNPGDPDYGTPDGTVDGADLSFYVELWLAKQDTADVTTTNTNPGDADYGTPDGTVDGADLSYFVEQWLAGCP